MSDVQLGHDPAPQDDDLLAERRFREALRAAREARTSENGAVGAVEAAVASYCRALRKRGMSPQDALKQAKRVIDEVIDGHQASVAERAVTVCIAHYYRAD